MQKNVRRAFFLLCTNHIMKRARNVSWFISCHCYFLPCLQAVPQPPEVSLAIVVAAVT